MQIHKVTIEAPIAGSTPGTIEAFVQIEHATGNASFRMIATFCVDIETATDAIPRLLASTAIEIQRRISTE